MGQGVREGFPMFVRMANAFRELAPIPTYDHHLVISVRLRNPRPDGFPSPVEGEDLATLEMKVCGILEAGNDSICVLVVTNNGLRDFIFYTRDVAGAKRKTEEVLAVSNGYVAEFWIGPDEKWEVYQQCCHFLKPAQPLETRTSA